MSNPSELIETKQNKILTDKDWKQKWEKRNIGFHEKNIHPLLAEFLNEMLSSSTQLNIFFPLCGKAVDMKWLADMGHTIVGVDVCEIGLKEFFEEQNVPYVEEAVTGIPGAKVFKAELKKRVASKEAYKPDSVTPVLSGGATYCEKLVEGYSKRLTQSTSGNISLYCCSIYDISDSVIGKFDGMWDRGALVAVNPKDRERYANVMLSLMNKDFRYLLVTVEYDPKLHAGPPFYVPASDVERLFGSLCHFKQLKKIDALTDKQRQWGLGFYWEKIYLVAPKSHS